VISWLSSGGGWGTREQAIPGEWAALVLLIVLGALLGLLVLWFTVLRHERTIRRRAARRPGPGARSATATGLGLDDVVALTGIGAAADESATPGPGAVLETEPESELAAANEDEDEDDEVDEEPAASEDDEAAEEQTPEQAAEPPAASSSQPAAGSGKRKLTDEILSRIETELARRETPRWKELAELVHREFGVTVHPSSIQKAVKRRRLVDAQGMAALAGAGVGTSVPDTTVTAEPATEPRPAPPHTRPESADDVRPNGGRPPLPWASPAYPAADAG